MSIDVYTRNVVGYRVQAVQVTEENLSAVAWWCHGTVGMIVRDEHKPHVSVLVETRKARTRNAYVGMWIVLRANDYLIYKDDRFKDQYTYLPPREAS